VTLIEIDRAKLTAKVKFAKTRFENSPDVTSLLPGGPLNTDSIEAAIERAVDSIIHKWLSSRAVINLARIMIFSSYREPACSKVSGFTSIPRQQPLGNQAVNFSRNSLRSSMLSCSCSTMTTAK